MANIKTLSGPALEREIAKRDAKHSLILDELIAAGRGHETPTETRCKHDALSVKFNASLDACADLAWERRHRMQWHGSLSPVRVAA